MRSIGLAVAALCLFALGSCGVLNTLSATEVPVKAIMVAANGVDGAETAATNYIRLCTPTPAPVGCNDQIIKTEIAPAVHAIRVARDAAEQFVTDNPGAKLGPKTLVDAVTDAVTVLQKILNQNSIPTK